MAAIDILFVAGMAHDRQHGGILQRNWLTSVLIRIIANDFFPVRRDICVRFFTLKSFVGMSFVTSNADVIT